MLKVKEALVTSVCYVAAAALSAEGFLEVFHCCGVTLLYMTQ